MTKIIIVEDDPGHLATLQRFLKLITTEIEILTVCSTYNEAIEALKTYNPDLVFMDVELDNGFTSFDLFQHIKPVSFDIIFTTSHLGKYINEIRACGISYLPKPLILSELQEAFDKYINKLQGHIGNKQVNSLISNNQLQNIDDKTVWIPSGFDYIQVLVKNIIYCEADNQYTTFFIDFAGKDLKQIVASRGIGEWEHALEDMRICRIHKQYMVNLKHVKKYTRGDGGFVTLFNEKSLPVSKTGKDKFLKMSGLH